MNKITLSIKLLFLCLLFTTAKLQAQDAYIGEIRMVGFNFEPRNWAFCDGRILSIAQNPALFSILGTTYGGNGTTTFALPDLRGRAPIHSGQGQGLSPMTLGSMTGNSTVTLTQANLPSHTHIINATTADGNTGNPQNAIPANTKLLDKEYTNSTANTNMSQNMVQPSGQNLPVNNMQPYTGMNYVICLYGVYPPRG